MRVIFGGGGTGGHLYPAISIAEELFCHNIDTYFYTSNKGMESKVLTKLGYKYKEQNVTGFVGKGIFGKIKSLYMFVNSIKNIFPEIKRDDKVVLTGGFAAAPVAFVAFFKGCDIYIHEQNSIMGLVNRVFAKGCKKVFLSFEDTKSAKGNILVTGNPVRRVFNRLKVKDSFTGSLLIIGGSQGSRAINKLIVESIDNIISAGFTVTHQTGEGLYGETIEAYGNKNNLYKDKLIVKAYIDSMAEAMSNADIIIGRSGSGTIFEQISVSCPAIYIPFKAAAEDHQYYNALSVVKSGGALIMEESKATPQELLDNLLKIKDNYKIYKDNLKKIKKPNSAKVIVKEILG